MAADASDWEDVEVKAAPDEAKTEKGAAALADDDEWEDV